MGAVYLAAFVGALVAAMAATPVARLAAIRLGVLDVPARRKVHVVPVPYLGGLAIVAGFLVAALIGARAGNLVAPVRQLGIIVGAALAVAVLGLWDDVKASPPTVRVLVEIGAASCVWAAGVQVHLFGIPFVDLALTIAWIVGVTNAFNYMDNMDGLSAGVAAIAAACFFALAALSQQVLVASLAAGLVGCSLGFLWYNRPPARIFMGDAGSLFLGFMLAVLGVRLRFANIAQVTFLVPVAVLAIPCLDTLLVSVSRLLRGRSPFEAGRDHISHRLVRFGLSPKAAVGLLYFASASCGWLGVVIASAHPAVAYLLAGWLAAVALFLGWVLLKVEVDS